MVFAFLQYTRCARSVCITEKNLFFSPLLIHFSLACCDWRVPHT